ncbi:MAG: precorrin-6y C5,15-methyltransferase (decarboxylating) subunit CbiE [Clostridia bacterium]|nr:precorrin-6y C5,15-methyltransferase (decarboxylating) subunit CbiE [Clostridia bacterium]
MNLIDIIGAGPGEPGQMTLAARAALDRADIVFAAPRFRTLVRQDQQWHSLLPFSETMEQLSCLLNSPVQIAVLVSGDTGLYSFLSLLTRRFGREQLRIFPGISSIQLFCARLGISWQDACIHSLHGRSLPPEAVCHLIRTHAKTFFLLDSEHDPNWIHGILAAGGLNDVRLTVAERLSEPDEQIGRYEPRSYDPLSILLIQNDHPSAGLPQIGLPDSAFYRNRTPMTKQEIRIQILCRLNLPQNAVVWDIGAGTGSITVEAARQCPYGQVYAIEKDEDAFIALQENIHRFYLQNVTLCKGTAPDALRALPAPTHVFIGGTGGQMDAVLDLLESCHTPVRLCATAITMESAFILTRRLGKYPDNSVVQIAVSRIETIGESHMLRAQNPVFLFTASINTVVPLQ